MNGWMNEWMDGWMDGWMNEQFNRLESITQVGVVKIK